MSRVDGSLFVGSCQCGMEIEFILLPAVYIIPYPTYLGACGRCGRRYKLDISITRNDDDDNWPDPRCIP